MYEKISRHSSQSTVGIGEKFDVPPLNPDNLTGVLSGFVPLQIDADGKNSDSLKRVDCNKPNTPTGILERP